MFAFQRFARFFIWSDNLLVRAFLGRFNTGLRRRLALALVTRIAEAAAHMCRCPARTSQLVLLRCINED